MKVDMIKIENQKEAITREYNKKICALYITEIKKVFKWFVAKYPKRHLEWTSGMGTCFWSLDGEIVDFMENYYDPRFVKLLKPLKDFEVSMHTVTNYEGLWIHIGDFNSNDYK